MQIPGYIIGFTGLFMFIGVIMWDIIIDSIEYNKFIKKRAAKKNIG